MGFKWYKTKNDVGISVGDITIKCSGYRIHVEWIRARWWDGREEVIYSVNIWVTIDPDPGEEVFEVVFNGIGEFMNDHLSECDECSCGNPCKRFVKDLKLMIKDLLKDSLNN